MVNITEEKLKKILPTNKNVEELCKALNEQLPKYDIDTKNRVAAFLAQFSHESVEFTKSTENLNYSAQGLRKIFPKYFSTDAIANQYARQPQKIANKVYANRMGNGNEASGDGWKHRGLGYAQTTGKDNQSAFASYINKSLEETLQYLQTPTGSLESACFYWYRNNLNRWVDKNDFDGLSKKINGGTIGLQHRRELYNKILPILQD